MGEFETAYRDVPRKWPSVEVTDLPGARGQSGGPARRRRAMRKAARPTAAIRATASENAPMVLDEELAGSVATAPGGLESEVDGAAPAPVEDAELPSGGPADVDGAAVVRPGLVPAAPDALPGPVPRGAPPPADEPGPAPGAPAPGAEVRGAAGGRVVGFGAGLVVGLGAGRGGAGGAIPG